MSRLRWPDSTNSVSDVPGTIQLVPSVVARSLLVPVRRWDSLFNHFSLDW